MKSYHCEVIKWLSTEDPVVYFTEKGGGGDECG